MGKGTSIEWTDVSWPVVNGCRRVSTGCERCYAERLTATRLSKTPKYQGLAVIGKNGPRWTGETRLWEPHLGLPLTIRKPSRIFVADMGDLFYERVESDDIAVVFGVMAACPQHTFQVLTKRPERMLRWFQRALSYKSHPREVIGALQNRLGRVDAPGGGWPLPNVWLGVSLEDQATADERIPLLLQTPAAVKFVSYEPALGPVDFRDWLTTREPITRFEASTPEAKAAYPVAPTSLVRGGVDWVIVGGESGPGARHFDISWARSTIEQCRKAGGTACFVKQLGARPTHPSCESYPAVNLTLTNRKGGDMAEWPADLCVRDFPQPRSTT